MKKYMVVILFSSFTLVGCGKKEPTAEELQANREVVAQDSVKKLLKDPSSAEFRNMNGLCGEVNSKNSFGGYGGYKRFIGTPDLTIIEGENAEIDQATFDEVWQKMC
ncbi:hypothetical protein [Acinetobacter sp. WCHAc060007]|uniref:hypothetical protein n=1 Tax=Acinetobacter sp. WCHAc060007 TaxID=2419605 RepID=UPI000EA2DF12|nr:hypothetical protein [Acinetobacter sp. WCHAc060007]RKG40717.1 hypothetical protein D7V31_11515 [Acinetobacter sp. WCHAc060007]